MRSALCVLFLAMFCVVPAQAMTFNFQQVNDSSSESSYTGPADSAVVSGTMSFNLVSPTQLVVTVDNTSPTTTNGGQANQPFLRAFGWELSPDDGSFDPADVTSWQMKASDGSTNVVIGTNTDPKPWELEIGGSLSGISVDFIPQQENPSKGRLFNPALGTIPTSGSGDNFFTTAILTINFASTLSTPPTIFMKEFSPFMRFQAIGPWGGSAKVTGIVPVPSSAAMLLALIGPGALLFVWRRRAG